jgi:hypothetical protein
LKIYERKWRTWTKVEPKKQDGVVSVTKRPVHLEDRLPAKVELLHVVVAQSVSTVRKVAITSLTVHIRDDPKLRPSQIIEQTRRKLW